MQENNLNNKFRKVFQGAMSVGKVVAAVNEASIAAISAVGFTAQGVGGGTIAASIQSTIGAVKAGSAFAYLQSVGALGQGILGTAAVPVVAGASAVGAIAYAIYQNRQEIGDFIVESREKVEKKFEKLKEQLKNVPEKSKKIAAQVAQKSKQIADQFAQKSKQIADNMAQQSQQIAQKSKHLFAKINKIF